MTAPNVLDALRVAEGVAVSTTDADLAAARTDKSGHVSDAAPIAVVSARSIEDVQTVMRIATATGTPVVTRGAGTGLAGGALGGAGEIVLSTLGMTRIHEINEPDLLAVVDPGVINGAFNDLLLTRGLWFAPDPASRAISTVGGNIATGAGGLLCAKYGVTRDAVLALKVVLADGRLISVGHRSIKGVTGLDLTSLMVGSEGVLGVIVEATVRIRRITPGTVATIAAYFPDVVTAAGATAAVTAAGIQPSIMELLDPVALVAVHRYLRLPTPSSGEAHVVVQTDGPSAELEAAAVLEVLRAAGGRAEMSTDHATGEHLLAVRRALHPSLEWFGTPLIEDVSVPRSQLAAMFAEIGDIERRYGITIPTVAHAGDGNLHPNFVFEGTEVPDHIWQAAEEHGIGLLKKRWLGDELGADQLGLQHGIKRLFDPQNLLNPGKVF
jgi:glycolate oxidase